MVGSNLVMGACQADHRRPAVRGHGGGLGDCGPRSGSRWRASAFFFPASAGVVPQTVPESLLQQANAALRLSRNATVIVGGALAGLVVAATSPATGIAVDAATFFLAAAFIGAMHLPASLRMEARSFRADLSEGWQEFSSRTWLWAIVLQFSVVAAVEFGAQGVLGPAVANESLHGPAGWGLVLASNVGGVRRRRSADAASAPPPDAPDGDSRDAPHRAAPVRARGPAHARGRLRPRVRGRRGHRDVRRPLGHHDAAGDPAGPALPRLFVRRVRLVGLHPARARRGRADLGGRRDRRNPRRARGSSASVPRRPYSSCGTCASCRGATWWRRSPPRLRARRTPHVPDYRRRGARSAILEARSEGAAAAGVRALGS